MALTPPNNEAFLREVDDALRHDQLVSFWTRFGRWIVAAIVAGLIAFAGWLYWSYHRGQVAEQASEQLASLIDGASGGRIDEKAAGALVKDGQPGYRAAALLTRAGVAMQKGDTKGAVAIYGQLAGDASLDQPYRDLGLIRQTALEFDRLKPQQVIDRLKPLAQVGNPWFGSAGEMVAIAYMKNGQPKLAGPIFAAMAQDQQVPQSIRTRAVQMAGLLGVDAVDAVKSPLGENKGEGEAANGEGK